MAELRRFSVLTAVGPDRPGLVRNISRAVHEASANLEDSRMALLGGEFALIMLLSGTPQALAKVETQRSELETTTGLTISLRSTSSPATKHYLAYRLSVSGVDHPGIVSSLSEILAQRNVNVASLDTRVTYAPLSGTPMFTLRADLQIPTELELTSLRKDLVAVCEEENLDFTLESTPS